MSIDRAEQIARARRQQPITELERKARKAGRRRRGVRGGIGFSEEAKDLAFARDHVWRMRFRGEAFVKSGGPDIFCYLCHGFGPKGGRVAHKGNCTLGLTPPQIYAGTVYTGAIAKPAGVLP